MTYMEPPPLSRYNRRSCPSPPVMAGRCFRHHGLLACDRTPIEETGVHRVMLCSPHQGCRGDGKPGTAGRVGDAWQQQWRLTDSWRRVGGVVALAHGWTTQAWRSWRVAAACLGPP